MKTDRPKISIIMNCYNGEKYLSQTLISVVSQTYTNWEIIFWDNQSFDKSASIFNSFEDSRFKYFYALNHTELGLARNSAIQLATGDWCAILDCDDYWEINKLQKQVDAINENVEFGLIYSNYFKAYSDGRIVKCCINKNISKKENLFKEIFTHQITIPWPTVLIKRQLLIDVNYFNDFKSVEDFDILLRLANICKFYCVEDCLAYYRIHSDQLSVNFELINNEIFDVYKYWQKLWDEEYSLSKFHENIIQIGKSRILLITGIRAFLQNSSQSGKFFRRSISYKFTLKAFLLYVISKSRLFSRIFLKLYNIGK